MSRIIPFSYYGGKARHLKWLLPLIPYDRVYCEPFSGSSSVFLNRRPSPIECINDVDGRVINFFRVLRDDGPALIQSLELTPYSREEFDEAAVYLRSTPVDESPLDSARALFVVLQQGFGSFTEDNPRWGRTFKSTSRGMAKHVSAFLGKIENMPQIVERLKMALIENKDALVLIPEIDSEQTVFYCDPPYLHTTRRSSGEYKFENGTAWHDRLCQVLSDCEGKVVLSGYPNDLYDDRLEGWRTIERPVKNMYHNDAVEMVWCNFGGPQ